MASHSGSANSAREAIARAGEPVRWTLYLQRGGALEQAGRWDAALPDLKRAVALAPDEPQTQKRPRVLRRRIDRIKARTMWHAARYHEARLTSHVARGEKGTEEKDLLYYCCLHS